MGEPKVEEIDGCMRLLKEFEEEDSLRFYFLGKRWRNRREHHGIKRVLDPDEPLIA